MGPHAPGVTFTNTNSTTNGYDERGNKITQSLSTTINFSDGKSQRRSGSYTYQYDANDFLLRLLVQSSETDITGSTTMQSNDHSYEYSNNRLINTATVTLQQMVQPQAALYTSTTDKAA